MFEKFLQLDIDHIFKQLAIFQGIVSLMILFSIERMVWKFYKKQPTSTAKSIAKCMMLFAPINVILTGMLIFLVFAAHDERSLLSAGYVICFIGFLIIDMIKLRVRKILYNEIISEPVITPVEYL